MKIHRSTVKLLAKVTRIFGAGDFKTLLLKAIKVGQTHTASRGKSARY